MVSLRTHLTALGSFGHRRPEIYVSSCDGNGFCLSCGHVHSANGSDRDFYSIWLVMTVFVMGIGFYNHLTLNHLPNTSLYLGPAYKQHYPTAVFFNQNDFATFLSISFFLYVACMRQMKNGYIKAFGLLGAILALYLILLTESRASLLGILAGAAIYVWLLMPRFLKSGPSWQQAGLLSSVSPFFSQNLFCLL